MELPKLHQVDSGRELSMNHNVAVRRGRFNIHRDQTIVEQTGRAAIRASIHEGDETLSGKRSTEWVALLTAVISALNSELTRLTCEKSSVQIRHKGSLLWLPVRLLAQSSKNFHLVW